MNNEAQLAHEEEPTIRQNNDIIWHYTSSDVFTLMADGKTGLYATDHRFLNDSDELSYGINTLESILSEMKDDPHLFCQEIGIELSNDLKLPLDFPSEQIIDDCLQALQRVKRYKVTLYLTCFSHAPDSLYQWRSYTPNGGMAIGFSLTELKKEFYKIAQDFVDFSDFTLFLPLVNLILEGEKTSVPYYTIIGKCVYDFLEQKKVAYRTIINMKKMDTSKMGKNIFSPILSCIALFKNSSFLFENEERIVLCGPLLCKCIEVIAGKPRVAIPGYDNNTLKQKIKGVFISPHGNKLQNHVLAQDLIFKNDIECNVFDSHSTYIGG